jgi:hypothetical protein
VDPICGPINNTLLIYIYRKAVKSQEGSRQIMTKYFSGLLVFINKSKGKEGKGRKVK